MTARFSVRESCVGVVTADGDWQMAVFPESVRFVGDRLEFDDGNGTAVLGTALEIGGGGLATDEADQLEPGLSADLAACPPSDSLWIVNARLPQQ